MVVMQIRSPRSGKRLGQTAADFVSAYGLSILVITIVIYIVFQFGVFNYRLTSPSCISPSGFLCQAASIFANGTVYIIISQASGGTMNVTGVACATAINTTGDAPQFGNVRLLGYKSAPQYYPNAALANGLKLYSGTIGALTAYCYNNQGIASGIYGQTFTGYVWINYTLSGLPPGIHYVDRVAAITSRYT